MDRLFFALRPDVAAARRIERLALDLRESLGLTARPLAADRLHVTLCFLGDYAELAPPLVAAADAAANGLRHAPVELTFDRVMSFRRQGDAPVVLCRKDECAPLAQLRASLREAVACTQRFKPDSRGFKPHVTLLYDRQPVPLREIAPIGWSATEVLLIRSLIGRGKHEVLGRYPLR